MKYKLWHDVTERERNPLWLRIRGVGVGVAFGVVLSPYNER